jgi:hypothetical protein
MNFERPSLQHFLRLDSCDDQHELLHLTFQ